MSDQVGGRAWDVALVGYGLGGEYFHAPLIAATPGLRLTHVVTRDAGRRARARRDHPGVRVVDDAGALWEADVPRPRLVVVTTPNRTHAPLAHAALAAGCDVVVDKPIAMTAAEGRALADDAGARGRLLVPYQNRRWDGDFLTARRLVAEGTLGEVMRFESRIERWRPAPRPGWKSAPGEGGGLLLDLGSHLVDQARQLLGPVTHVYAELDRRRPDVVAEDDAFVALAHASGARSHLWMSAVAADAGAAPRFRILGTRAAWVKHGFDAQEDALRAGMRPGAASWGEEPRERWGALHAGDGTATHVPTVAGAWPEFYGALARALDGAAPPPVLAGEAVEVLEILDAAERSAAEGRVVALAEMPPA